ncbi:n-terminal domain protein [Ichthyophthirius multifiliis]|uniref:N-terminal domain protein n=1 Tax=Ichthyophthirius multifiliis TaxID=5932 RepID=G0QUE6_ICHMU|nr:n-terminal domain protein [Ichthyophthirius multifiliis]EGR31142.1 n-terminal domain protein [Ichthyophthirius multifiliis]|eukprot:XP_004034628.1 n-terminal domain protein [Ichthyophthirius multifiliis]
MEIEPLENLQKIKNKVTSISTSNTYRIPIQKILKDSSIPYQQQQYKQLEFQQKSENNQSNANILSQTSNLNKNVSDNKKIQNSYKEESLSLLLARIQINKNYLQDIITFEKQQESKYVPKNCLFKHNIPQLLRAKMLDWLIEVVKAYKFSEETYFMTVRLLDLYLEKTKKIKEISDIHLVGVTCFFIASKYEEIYPITLKVIDEKISHKKISEQQIKNMEADILITLNFNLFGTSPYEISMQTLTFLNYQDRLSNQEFQYVHKICSYLSKMILYDYENIKMASYSTIAASVLYIIFKIIQQINLNFSAEENIQQVLSVLQIEQKLIIQLSIIILDLAKKFDIYYPQFQNLKKFNGFENKFQFDNQFLIQEYQIIKYQQ